MRPLRLPAGWPRRRTYPLIGAALAMGAPLGLLALRGLLARALPTPAWLFAELRADPAGLSYITLATLAVFVLLGRILGAREDALARSSITDPLTRLYNRRHIDARLAEEIARYTRHGPPVALLLLDVDHLKEINDRGGHEAGDAALCAVADTLRRTCRVTDLAARYGGDEFVVLLPSTQAGQALDLAERIRAGLRAKTRDLPAPVTLSIGIADLDLAGAPHATALFEAADAALYAAKAQGRDRAVLAPRPEARQRGRPLPDPTATGATSLADPRRAL